MSFSYSKYCRVLFELYLDCAKSASKALWQNYIIIIASFALYFAFALLAPMFRGLGIAGQFIISLAAIAALATYYGWLSEAKAGRKLKPRDLKDFDSSIFFSLISVGFVLWIFSLLIISPFSAAFKDQPIALACSVIIFIFLNPIAEIIQSARSDGMSSVKDSIQFTIENWVEWFLPNAILLLPWFLRDPDRALIALAGADPLFPFGVILNAVSANLGYIEGIYGWLQIVLGLILAHWFMLFRAFLFSELGRGTRRQRLFQLQSRGF